MYRFCTIKTSGSVILVLVVNCYFGPRRGKKYCTQHVHVCLYTTLSWKPLRPNFNKFSVIIRLYRSYYVRRCGLLLPTEQRGLSVCHTSELGKNGWTDRDAIWVEDSAGPREPCIRWGPDPPWEGTILRGEGHPIAKYTVNHKKCDIAFLTITLANLNRFLQFLYHFNRE